ncbi:dihydrolipoyllysine-residue acetyltransferase component of pyruvate dehydrogenase complex [Glaciecola punicea ACAM 611]|uniref:Acetyltransferase component of pyruvate dehydrogenase complex n=1 Tax=Glaciecola punicea ACAM 611 TaxID=1121923 RepID=H5TDN8_9ALTE|nr:dihydrolipoyllysine-residue acetyltransferase [Glaciecola punicea]GAB56415.1 dihydrolipoyllysine-residue acetyltransferase component of pyruvate dehydrogenase complex [Glaciecola punicea ACAM 611]
MADLQDIIVPDVGGEEVEIIEICVALGDSVEAEAAFVTVESDKASMDIPVPFDGVIKEISVKVGDKIKQGDLLGKASSTESAAPEQEAPKQEPPKQEPPKQDAPKQDASKQETPKQEAPKQETAPAASSATSVIEVTVPDIGDASDVEIIELLVKEGDTVAEEDGLITLETDKATMDVPAPRAGKIVSMKVKMGDKVSEGSLVLTLEVGASNGADTQAPAASAPQAPEKEEAPKLAESHKQEEAPEKEEAPKQAESAASSASAQSAPVRSAPVQKTPPVPYHPSAGGIAKTGRIHATPSVRRMAREFGVDLAQVTGSARKGRIAKEDVQSYVKYELSRPKLTSGTNAGSGGMQVLPPPKVDFAKFGEIEEVALTRIQKLSGPNLHRNWVTIPHVTQFEEADITDIEDFRKQQNQINEKRKLGVKITPLVFMMKAVADAMKHYPTFNSSLSASGESLILKKYTHIGIAVDTPNGLVVPVVRDVDKKGIMDISRELTEISAKAREGKLKTADMQGSCFTISSLGGIGGTAFTPIVNAPDVAILGVSKSEMRPKWDGKEFLPRLMLPLSLSYDHRVIDGALAARFAVHLADCLADMRRILL